jgi:hypothetical protein
MAVSDSTPAARWPLALAGLALLVFAAVALSGPGRIDIVDGQARFEVGRSLVEHGDSVFRDERIWWSRFPGRDGNDYSLYRLPQSLVAAACILVADATGPVVEGRRHFIFSLHGAALAAGLAVLYAVWFRRTGRSPAAAVGWAAAGVFCTPAWFYATSTFDDLLGTVAVVAAVVVADRARAGCGPIRALAAGLLVGFALNCKPPLAAFAVPALAAADDPTRPRAVRLLRAGLVVVGVLAGYAEYKLYYAYKFPPEYRALHGPILEKYAPVFFGNPVSAVLDFAAGPASGSLWYFPPVLLAAAGVSVAGPRWRVAVAAVLAGATAVGFFALLTFYKGDPTWGPRYLTPVFGVLWLFAPAGADRVSRPTAGILLAAGFAVQVLGLSIDPHRLYVQRGAPSAFYLDSPWYHFRPEMSHLLNRPREVREAWAAGPAPEFTPAPTPTFAPPVIDPPYLPETGPAAVDRWQIWRGFRPWWASFPHLSAGDRPVDLTGTAAGLGAAVVVGAIVMSAGLRRGPGAGSE